MFPTLSIPDFSIETCRAMAVAANEAYWPQVQAATAAHAAAADSFEWIECPETDTQCFIARKVGADGAMNTVLAFRGSASVRDWISDMEIRRRSWCGVSVHRGFADCLDSVWSRIEGALSGHPGQNLWITGHSLGGALAVLAARAALTVGFPPTAVYTFGQPRVGSGEFVAAYDLFLRSRTFRLVNAQDIVPRLPGFLAGYRHCGTEIFLDAFGGAQVNPPLARKVWSDLVGIYHAWLAKRARYVPTEFISDHFMGGYAERLNVAGRITHNAWPPSACTRRGQ